LNLATLEADDRLAQLNRRAAGFVQAYAAASAKFSPQLQPKKDLRANPPTPRTDIDQLAFTYPILITVANVCEEWQDGLVEGPNGKRRPAAKTLENRYGTSWRKGEMIRKRFYRKRVIIQRLTKVSERLQISEREAARKLDSWKFQKKISLDKLQKSISKDAELFGPNDQDLSSL
jgi:hypothetical protein